MIAACKLQLFVIAIVLMLGNVLAQEPDDFASAAEDLDQDINELQGATAQSEIVPELQGWQSLSFEEENPTQHSNQQQGGLAGLHEARMNAIVPGAERFLPPGAAQPYVTANPSSGQAPLTVTLQVEGMGQTPFWLWELDRDGDGDVDTGGQGPSTVQVVYDQPGTYVPVFTFYDDANQIIASASGSLTVTGQGIPRAEDALLPAETMTAAPSEGYAPLQVLLDARSIAPPGYYEWSLDQYSGGSLSYPGGEPAAQVVYENPGSFNATIVFYDSQMQEISRGRAAIQVYDAGTSQGSKGSSESGTQETGTQSQALTASPGGWGLLGGAPESGDSRPRVDLGEGSWSAPKEEFTEDLKPELRVFPERGQAPLTVEFDASGTAARYGVYRYNYDIAWGPNDAPDDGYYLASGSDPNWIHTFDEYGSYLVILDVEDNRGERSRVTKVVFVL